MTRLKLYMEGLGSIYEPEQLTRMFYRQVELAQGARHKTDCVLVRANSRQIFCAVRQDGRIFCKKAPRPDDLQLEMELCRMLFQVLSQATGKRPPWGILTGVRPVRLVHRLWQAGKSDEEVRQEFSEQYLAVDEKIDLALSTARAQRPIIEALAPRSCSLYIGIPFCPSRCSYCSFVSRTLAADRKLVAPYVEKLCEEIRAISRIIREQQLKLCTIYIGGGTPTSLTADQLRQLMSTVADCFDLNRLEEYTVEAGRPDCTDYEKLCVLKQYGADRISINPQTFCDRVLAAIGRKHTAEDVIRCYEQARRAGHNCINMDLIAGLPKDTVDGFEESLRKAIALEPENITVHTLTLKRASNLVIDHAQDQYQDVAAMLQKTALLQQAGYGPYYLYRQKGTLQNLENVGFSKPGFEGRYNVYIMEELHSILSAGAGGMTKLKGRAENRIERIANYKYPQEYLDGFNTVLKRKERIGAFYACDLDS